jgi:hypothetical protein
VAFRRSTVGSGVREGKTVAVAEGAGVSVKGAVGGTVAVSVGAGEGNEWVGRGAVSVGDPVTTGTEGGVELQANKVSTHRVEKTSCRLI